MNVNTIVDQLAVMGISLEFAPPDRIRLITQGHEPPDAAIAMARRHKPELIEHLRSACQPHNNPENRVDQILAERPGWIRSTCRHCGRFVGYRRNDTSR